MTPNAEAFIAANKRSDVVYGAVIEQYPRKAANGARYRLSCGRTFELTAEECVQVGKPRWDFRES